MKRFLVVGLLAAVLAASAGCESAMTREWTVKASVVETGIIAHCEYWPAETPALSAEQIKAFGAARVALYEAYGEQLKAAIEGLKD
jgi:hypothetical protein